MADQAEIPTKLDEELPDEVLIPTRLVLEAKAFGRVVKMLERPPAPTEALRKLMRGDR